MSFRNRILVQKSQSLLPNLTTPLSPRIRCERMNCTIKCDTEAIKKVDPNRDELDCFVLATTKNPSKGGIKSFELESKPSISQWKWILSNDSFSVQDPYAIAYHGDSGQLIDSAALQIMIDKTSEEPLHFYVPSIKTVARASTNIEEIVKRDDRFVGIENISNDDLRNSIRGIISKQLSGKMIPFYSLQ